MNCTENQSWYQQRLTCIIETGRFPPLPSSNLHLDSISKIPYRISQILQEYGMGQAISVLLMRCWRFTLDGMSYIRTHSTDWFISVYLITRLGDCNWRTEGSTPSGLYAIETLSEILLEVCVWRFCWFTLTWHEDVTFVIVKTPY